MSAAGNVIDSETVVAYAGDTLVFVFDRYGTGDVAELSTVESAAYKLALRTAAELALDRTYGDAFELVELTVGDRFFGQEIALHLRVRRGVTVDASRLEIDFPTVPDPASPRLARAGVGVAVIGGAVVGALGLIGLGMSLREVRLIARPDVALAEATARTEEARGTLPVLALAFAGIVLLRRAKT